MNRLPRGSRILLWAGGIIALLAIAVLAGSFFSDEPLRRRMEAQMNRSLEGYRVTLPYLDFSLIGFSVTLKNLNLVQNAHPDPLVGRIERLRASIHWKALLRARLVADFELNRPEIHVNLMQLRKETKGEVPVEERGWQGAVNAIYPFKVNLLTIRNGKFTYIDNDPDRPLELSQIFLQAENIRNIYSPEQVYPSPFQLNARVFEKGRAQAAGRANFLAKPHPGVEAEIALEQVELAYFRPVLARLHLAVTGGVFTADGRLEYAPDVKTAHLKTMRIEGVRTDYIHTAGTAQEEKEKVEKAGKAAEEVANRPGLLLRIDDLHLTGEVGFVNKAQDPSYRIFLHKADLRLNNLSNHFREGQAEARLSGYFMGSGETRVLARFRPEKDGPDFDLFVRVLGTKLKSLNDLLAAYGDFDVTRGSFSLFTEMHVRNQQVSGFVKPFFEDVDVYDPRQDEEKNLFQKLYEAVIDGVAELFENEASDQVATKADISGPIDDPEASTWQVIVNLIQNAFFKQILPGFVEGVKSD